MIGNEVFRNVHHHTLLLESLNWDESQLAALLEYIDTELNADIVKQPGEIAKAIKEIFGEQTSECFTTILNEVMFSCNLHRTGGDYEN